jgi:hypothetical protein
MAKATAHAVDFSSVKERGAFNPKRVEAGDYAAIVTKVEDTTVQKGDNAGDFMYVFTLKLQKFSQNTYPYRCALRENQLWKLRNLAVAAGINVPKKRMKFDPNKLVGKLVGVTMEDDEYEKDGKTQYKSEISAVFPAAELADGVEPTDESDESFDEDAGPQAVAADDGDVAEEPKKDKKKKKDKAAKEEPEAEPEPAKKDKKKDKGKKKKKGDENLEELNVSDL